MSWSLYRVERTIQKPHSAFQRSLTSSFSKLEGTPTLIVLGGSARTLGNMNRPIIAVNAASPEMKEAQPTKPQGTQPGTSRRPGGAPAAAVAAARCGRGARALGTAFALP